MDAVKDDLITVTIRREDLDNAISAIVSAHGEFCISSDKCGCYEVADRLERELNK